MRDCCYSHLPMSQGIHWDNICNAHNTCKLCAGQRCEPLLLCYCRHLSCVLPKQGPLAVCLLCAACPLRGGSSCAHLPGPLLPLLLVIVQAQASLPTQNPWTKGRPGPLEGDLHCQKFTLLTFPPAFSDGTYGRLMTVHHGMTQGHCALWEGK